MSDDDPAANAVADAVLAALRAVVEPVHDAHVPTTSTGAAKEERYAVLWPAPARRDSEGLTGRTTAQVHRWQVTSVGPSRRSALWVAGRCAAALAGRRLDVPGLLVDPVAHESSSQVRRDDDLPGQPLFVTTDTYSTTTR